MNSTIQTVTPIELKKWLEDGKAVLVDVREIVEYKQNHIKNATHLPLSEVSLTHANMPKHERKRLVFHCKSGRRSMLACEKICAEGKEDNLYNLTGGIDAWMHSQLPVETSGKKVIPLERQVLLAAGLIVFLSIALGFVVSSSWFLLAGFAGIGMMFAGLTGWCGMVKLLARMPWNK